MTPEDQKEFADDFPAAPPTPAPVERNLPVLTIAMTAGLAALILLLVFSY